MTTQSGAAAAPSDAVPAGGPTAPGPARQSDLRLARIHLRTGLLSLARAELEMIAGRDALDGEASADLAEARWRMGDLEGAAQAARMHIDGGGQEILAFVIAAEALAAQGRLGEARRLVVRVRERTPQGIEALFAGQPRHGVWRDPAPQTGPRSPEARASREGAPWDGSRRAAAPDLAAASASRTTSAQALPPADAPAPGPEALPRGPDMPATAPDAPPALADELFAVEAAVDAGDLEAVAARLALVLRMDRQLAPVVLSLADRALSGGEPMDGAAAALHLVRGDAYRVLGRETAAAQAFEASRRSLGARAPAKEHP